MEANYSIHFNNYVNLIMAMCFLLIRLAVTSTLHFVHFISPIKMSGYACDPFLWIPLEPINS